VAQRLLRRLCESCRIPISPISEDWTDEERRLAKIYGTLPAVRAAGCGSCGNTGYRGRLAVAEVLVNTPKLQELVLRGAGTAQLE
jgi:type II secretory ATPase GspE/PulE/Tfp pilus assembly ATPase PilB-like protein